MSFLHRQSNRAYLAESRETLSKYQSTGQYFEDLSAVIHKTWTDKQDLRNVLGGSEVWINSTSPACISDIQLILRKTEDLWVQDTEHYSQYTYMGYDHPGKIGVGQANLLATKYAVEDCTVSLFYHNTWQEIQVRKGRAISRIFLTWARKNLAEEDKYILTHYEKLFAWLGDTWKQTDFLLRLSANPADFLKLGHMVCDDGSCFAFGHECSSHKATLMQMPNSFVLQWFNALSNTQGMCSREVVDKVKAAEDPVCRAWGFFIPGETLDTNMIYFSNAYGLSEYAQKEGMEAMAEAVLNCKVQAGDDGISALSNLSEEVYQNGDGIVFSAATGDDMSVQDVERGLQRILKTWTQLEDAREASCSDCGEGIMHLEDVYNCGLCDTHLCHRCLHYSCSRCDLTICQGCQNQVFTCTMPGCTSTICSRCSPHCSQCAEVRCHGHRYEMALQGCSSCRPNPDLNTTTTTSTAALFPY